MSIFTGKMSKKTRALYDFMWGEKEWLKDLIEPTAQSEGSDTTYQFKGKDEEKERILGEIFGLDKGMLKLHFDSVCGGDGNEDEKINILHSSSLCGMLFFYNVSGGNKFNLQINGETIVFDTVTFEFKNSVIRNPSNMDIVLLSEDKKHVLFLESKFSEYYMSAGKKSSKISNAYMKNDYSKELYAENVLTALGISEGKPKTEADKKFIMVSNEEVYLDGIKQMISHYIGVCRRISGEKNNVDKHNDKTNADKIIESIKNGAKVYLGEILFDFENTNSDDNETKMHFKAVADVYREKYEKLAAKMNELIKNKEFKNEFEVLPKNLKYSDVKKWHNVDAKVLEYYNL